MGRMPGLEEKAQGQFSAEAVPSLQRLLDVISSILAEEYIMVAKQNPEVFLQRGSKT